MGRSQHTPGPWRLAPWYGQGMQTNPNRWSGIYEPIPGQKLGSRSMVLGVGIKGAEVDDFWLSMGEADARLIKAAPDLLAALKLLVADVADYEAWQRPCHALDVARAAIEKAEPSSFPTRNAGGDVG